MKLTEWERENMNRPITSTEFELVIKNFLQKKSLAQDVYIGEFYKTFKGQIISILQNSPTKYRENTSHLISGGQYYFHT